MVVVISSLTRTISDLRYIEIMSEKWSLSKPLISCQYVQFRRYQDVEISVSYL
jgi:hypothetical protein